MQLSEIEKYAFFALRRCRAGTSSRTRSRTCSAQNQCYVAQSDIDAAVQQFTNPDVSSSKAANAAALGKKLKLDDARRRRRSRDRAERQRRRGRRGQRLVPARAAGYKVILPPNNLEPNAPAQIHPFHTKVYFDPSQPQAKAAAVALAKLIAPADVRGCPRGLTRRSCARSIRARSSSSSSARRSTARSRRSSRSRRRCTCRRSCAPTTSPGHALLDPLVHKVPFKLETPTVLERNSYPDTSPGDTPVRLYDIAAKQKAVRLVFRTGGNEYWGIEETSWDDAPAL